MSDDVRSTEVAGLIARAADVGISLDERLEAFGQVVQYYQQMVYGCAYAILGDFHLAEDAAQEAFLIAYRQLADLREAKAFAGWLRRIVTNYCLAQVRRRGISAVSLAVVPEPESGEPPAEGVDDAAGHDAVAALRSLPEDQREAMALFYVDGYSQQEIAKFLEIPVNTLKARLFRSRARLKQGKAGQVERIMKSSPLSDDFTDAVIRRAASTTDLKGAAGLMSYIASLRPEHFRSAASAAKAGIFVVGEEGKVSAAGYFNKEEMLIGSTVIPCSRAAELARESRDAPHPAMLRAYQAYFKLARQQDIHLALVHGSQYDHPFVGFVPCFYYPIATLPAEQARQLTTSVVCEKADAQECQAAQRAFLLDPHAPRMHPRMTPGEIVVIRQDGQTAGYARIKSTLERTDSAVMRKRPLDYTLLSDLTVRTHEAARAAIKLAGELTAKAGRKTMCMMQSHLTLVTQTIISLGGEYRLRRPCNDVRLGAQMACILDLAGLTRLLEGEFQDRLSRSAVREVKAAFSFEMNGELAGFQAENGRLRLVQLRQSIHRYLPRWIVTRLYLGYYSGEEVLAMGPLPWDRSDGIVPDDLQLDNSPLTLPEPESALFCALFPKLWPTAWPDTDVWAWLLGQKHPTYYFGFEMILSAKTKATIGRLRFPWLGR
jgi:RNA polymerase sigma factor (sigma-70 family)